jgi:hypothetical protein
VTLAGAGACTVVASQAGSADWEPATDVARGFAIGRAGHGLAKVIWCDDQMRLSLVRPAEDLAEWWGGWS